MATVIDDRGLSKLLDVLCDVRLDKRELVELVSLEQLVAQEEVFKFILEYIKWYSFQYDVGSFVNENMEIALVCKNLKMTLD